MLPQGDRPLGADLPVIARLPRRRVSRSPDRRVMQANVVADLPLARIMLRLAAWRTCLVSLILLG